MWFSQSFSDHDHISATEMPKTDFNTLLGWHVDNVDIGSLRFRYSGTGNEGHENHEGGSRWNVRRWKVIMHSQVALHSYILESFLNILDEDLILLMEEILHYLGCIIFAIVAQADSLQDKWVELACDGNMLLTPMFLSKARLSSAFWYSPGNLLATEKQLKVAIDSKSISLHQGESRWCKLYML